MFSVAYNGDKTKLLIVTSRRVVIKDINTGKEHQPFTANAKPFTDRVYRECIISVAYNRDETKLLIQTDSRVVIKDINTGDESQPFTAYGESMFSVAYNGDETKLLIVTDRRIVICDLLNGLDIEHKQLLSRALESWQQDKPYSICNDDELEIYRSLLDNLQKPELFDVEEVRLKERLHINNVPVNIKLPSMASLTASILRIMFNWGSDSQE